MEKKQPQKTLLSFFAPKRTQPDSAAKPAPPAKRPKDDETLMIADVGGGVNDDEIEDFSQEQKVAPRPPAPAAPPAAPPPAPPAAREAVWCWLNDDGKWAAFSKELHETIARASAEGKKTVDVDSERYVDFATNTQRRKDDPQKRRLIALRVPNADTPPPSSSSSRLATKPKVPVVAAAPAVAARPPAGKVRWVWMSDEGFKQYDAETSEKLESGWLKKADMIPIDAERFVDLKAMTQRRFDDSSKKRTVRREAAAGSPVPSPPPSPGKPKLAPVPAPAPVPPKRPAAAAAGAPKVIVVNRMLDLSGGPAPWFFCQEEISNTWCEYPKEVSERIEEAARRDMKVVKVDEERYVDLQNMMQRRYDDKTRLRYVRRKAPPAGAHVVSLPIPVLPASKAVSPGDRTLILDDAADDTEPDENLQKMARAAPAAAAAAAADPPAAAGAVRPPVAVPAAAADDSGGDETEEDAELLKMVPDAAAAPDAPPASLDDDTAPIVDPEQMVREEAALTLEQRRARYKCGDEYSQLAAIPTWQQWLEKKPREYRAAFFAPSAELNRKVSLWQGDLTRVEIDAIVNAAKPSLMGGGGIDGAIHKTAGHKLDDYCMTLGGCNVGEAKLSPGFKLPAKYIIHTVGPIGEKPELLRKCYISTLDLAKEKGIRTLALCCISTGIYGYPNKTAAHVALRAARQWLDVPENTRSVDRVIFCVFLDKDKRLYKIYMPQYFPQR